MVWDEESDTEKLGVCDFQYCGRYRVRVTDTVRARLGFRFRFRVRFMVRFWLCSGLGSGLGFGYV